MKRRTEINIELTRTLLVHRRPASPCPCDLSARQVELDAPDGATVLIDVNARMIPEVSGSDQDYSVESADSGEAIEIESAEGQYILAAAVRSLEQRLSAEARAALRRTTEQTAAPRFRFSRILYAKLRRFRHLIIHPKSSRYP